MDAADPNIAQPPADEYGAEVLCASWNPAAVAVAQPREVGSREDPRDFSANEAESFLSQFYRCQEA